MALRQVSYAEVTQVSVAVTDSSGFLVAMRRGDDRWLQAEIAIARAYSAAALCRDGWLVGTLPSSPPHWRSTAGFMAGHVSLGPGGVLLRRRRRDGDRHGHGEKITEAISVSEGRDAEVDDQTARVGAGAVRRDLSDDEDNA